MISGIFYFMCRQITMVRGFKKHVVKRNDFDWLVVLCY